MKVRLSMVDDGIGHRVVGVCKKIETETEPKNRKNRTDKPVNCKKIQKNRFKKFQFSIRLRFGRFKNLTEIRIFLKQI